MEIVLVIIGCLLVLWLYWYVALQFERIAQMKGHYEKRYFWLSLFFTIVGYLLVIALPDRGQEQKRAEADVTPVFKDDELPDL